MTIRPGTPSDTAATGWPADAERSAHDLPAAPAEPYPDHDDRPADDVAGRADDRADRLADLDGAATAAPLLDDAAAQPFAARWSDVQARFVDDPRSAVQAADTLVSELVREVTDRLERHRSGLEQHWGRGDQPDTEALRQALQQYRALFDRLLST